MKYLFLFFFCLWVFRTARLDPMGKYYLVEIEKNPLDPLDTWAKDRQTGRRQEDIDEINDGPVAEQNEFAGNITKNETSLAEIPEGSDGDEQDVKKVLGNVVDDIFKNSSDHGGKRVNTTAKKISKQKLETAIALSLVSDWDKPIEEVATLKLSDDVNITVCLSESLKKLSGPVDRSPDAEAKASDYHKKCNQSERNEQGVIQLKELDMSSKGEILENEAGGWAKIKAEFTEEGQPWFKLKVGEPAPTFLKDFQQSVGNLTDFLSKHRNYFTKLIAFMRECQCENEDIECRCVNEDIVKCATQRALLARPMSTDVISPLDTDLEKFIPEETIEEAEHGTGDEIITVTSGRRQSSSVIVGRRNANKDFEYNVENADNPLEADDEERKMNYWREDLLLHVFHKLWHTVSAVTNPRHRKRESFVYMHNELLKRYNFERSSNGLEPLKCPEDTFLEKIPLQSYTPMIKRSSITGRIRDCELTNGHKRRLKYNRRRLWKRAEDGSLDHTKDDDPRTISNYEVFAKRLEQDYHNGGHMYVATDCKSNDTNANYGGMAFSSVSARDPIFYFWHCEIRRMANEYIKNFEKPYEKKDLQILDDIRIENFKVVTRIKRKHSKDAMIPNKLRTFMENVTLTHTGKFKVKYQRQNHEPFAYTLNIRNNKRVKKRVIIRIHLLNNKLLTEDWSSSNNLERGVIEMDRFVKDLDGKKHQEIIRESSESSVSMKISGMTINQLLSEVRASANEQEVTKTFCGFPQNLLVPKGTNGEDKGKYIFIATVSDVEQSVTEGSDGIEHVMCGHPSGSAVFDSRRYGFPFDRAWNNLTLRDVEGSVKWREVEILHNMELKITEEKIEEKPKEVFPRRNSESWKKKRYARLMGRFRKFGRKFG